MLPDDLPIVTWLTSGRLPASWPQAAARASSPARPDTLLLADPRWSTDATLLGWSSDQLKIAAWPAHAISSPPADHIALIADTIAVELAPKEMEYSSHALLWDLIRNELTKDPLAVRQDVNEYLSARMRRTGIADEGFDRRPFIERLIVPAFQQGVARLLISAGVQLRLYGKGWNDLAEFRSHAAGPVASRQDLEHAVDASAVLLHCWPVRSAHPIESMGRPVIRCGSDVRTLLRDVKSALTTQNAGQITRGPELSKNLILTLTRLSS